MSISLSGLNAGLGDVYSSLLGGASTSAGSLLGNSSLLADYASIKNGSYGKMLKSYYAKQLAEIDDSDNGSGSKKAAKDTTTASAANTLNKSASALNNLNYSEDNIDEIYGKVSTFIDDYNSMIKNASQSELSSVNSQANILNNTTYSNYKMLAKAGITMNFDRTLSINEDTFKKADMSTLKTLFKGSNSFADKVADKASAIYRYAASGSALNYSYSNQGTYSSQDRYSFINSII